MNCPRRSLALAALLAVFSSIPWIAAAQSLYWIDTQFSGPTLNRADLAGAGATSIALTPGTLPEGLTAATTGRLYWVESAWSAAAVRRVEGDLSNPLALVSGGSALRGVALDETAGMLYWTSSNQITGPAIWRAPVGGGPPTQLIALLSGAEPRGIAVDHASGKLFWADFDADVIYSANLDGSAVSPLIALTAGSRPYGLTVDTAQQHLYWTEYLTGKLRRATFAGSGVTDIVTGILQPTHLVFESSGPYLFWAEGGFGTQRLRRSSSTGSGALTLTPPLATFGGLAVGPGTVLAAPAAELPTEFAIDRVWPSPSRGFVQLAYAIPRDADVHLGIFDLQGREIAVLADGPTPAGRHELRWDGRMRGGRAPAGVYFARMTAEGRQWVRRLVIAP